MTHPDTVGPGALGSGTVGSGLADGVDVPRPQLAGVLAGALRSTPGIDHAVIRVRTRCFGDVTRYDQLTELPTAWREALRRAESEAVDKLGVGVSPGAAHRMLLPDGRSVIIVHGDGWSLVGTTPVGLAFLLDVAPGVVIDRSQAQGADELVNGLARLLS